MMLSVLTFDVKLDAYDISDYDMGNRFYVIGDFNAALEYYTKILKSDEKELSENALYMTGKCQEMIGDSKEAERIYLDYLQKYPDSDKNPEILYTVAFMNMNKKKTQSPLETLKQLDLIIEQYPDFKKIDKVYDLKLTMMIQQESWQDAVILIQNLLAKKNNSNFDRYYYNLAEIYSNNKYSDFSYKKALEIYNKIIIEFPNSNLVGNCYFSMAQVYNMMDDWQNAILYYRKVMQNYPGEMVGAIAKTMIRICYLERNEYLYSTKSRDTIEKIFNSRKKPFTSLEEGLIRDIDDKSRVKLNIYADDSYKNLERALYTGNVNIEKDDLKIYANKVDCDLKNKVLFIKGNVRMLNNKGVILEGDNVEYDVTKNRITSSEKLKVMTVKEGKVVEKTGSKVILDLDSGKILLDNTEYFINKTGY
jgi:TolA-binding protein/lipopolysaccharide export system protein LptA